MGLIQFCKLSVCTLVMAGMCAAANAGSEPAHSSTSTSTDGLYLKVVLSSRLKAKKLKSGDLIEGHLSRDVYSADRKLFTAGDRVNLAVDQLEKRKRARNDHWPWVIRAFSPRHETYPVFHSAIVIHEGKESKVDVSLISVNRIREVQARAKKTAPATPADTGKDVEVAKTTGKETVMPTLVLEGAVAQEHAQSAAENSDSLAGDSPHNGTLPAGTRCKVLLLGDVSASRSKAGDAIQARLLEPLLLNSKVILPAGTIFQGKVLKQVPPRWLSRAGSLNLAFTDLTLTGGNQLPISASLAGAQLDAASHTRIDAEGRLHGERPGAAWMAINFGASAGMAKAADDGMQLIIEAFVSTATDASTAGSSRIVAGAISGVFMVTRHGRDVVLPRFTELQISLDRPVTLDMKPFETTTAAAGQE